MNGDVYRGDFALGKMSGIGAFTWRDGRVYEGEFSEVNLNGLGVQWSKDGQVLKCGRWSDDKLAESRPVPRSKLPAGAIHNAAGQPKAPHSTSL